MPAVLRTVLAALALTLSLAAPAAAPRCDARYLQVGVRFTRFSDSAHVRSVRVMLLNPDGTRGRGDSESFAASGKRLQLGLLHPGACGRSYLVRYRVNAGTRYRVRTFAVRIGEEGASFRRRAR